jgi:hypothetical protein
MPARLPWWAGNRQHRKKQAAAWRCCSPAFDHLGIRIFKVVDKRTKKPLSPQGAYAPVCSLAAHAVIADETQNSGKQADHQSYEENVAIAPLRLDFFYCLCRALYCGKCRQGRTVIPDWQCALFAGLYIFYHTAHRNTPASLNDHRLS